MHSMNFTMTMELNFRLYTRITWIVCLFACMSCSEQHPKLERLHQISPDSVIAHYDLSGDSLKEFPDLSGYTIRSLDLSHNRLDTIIPERLPAGLEKLDLSHNRLEGELEVKEGSMPVLRELDLSYNRLEGISVKEDNLRRLILTHNNLYERVDVVRDKARFCTIQYLDVSYNENLHLNKETFPIKSLGRDTFLVEGTRIKEEEIPFIVPPPALRSVFKFEYNNGSPQ